jgi:hypothetical protein
MPFAGGVPTHVTPVLVKHFNVAVIVALRLLREFLFPATELYALAVARGSTVAEPMSCAAAMAAASLEACNVRWALRTAPTSTTRALTPTIATVEIPTRMAIAPLRSWRNR